MKSKRWERIQELCDAGLEHEDSERGLFLQEACAGDSTLLSEIESLLAYKDASDDFIESGALEVAAKLLAKDLAQGSVFAGPDLNAFSREDSRYRIVDRLGAGGMGLVYKALDTKLGRFVALKFLTSLSLDLSLRNFQSPPFSGDRNLLRQTIDEARASSALDHPNICTVYEVDEYQGAPFIVMQLLTGKSLKHEIDGKPLSLERAIDIGLQITQGLDAAHAAGIIHLDIKPANIFVTQRDEVKILDFGLAKLVSAHSCAPLDAERSPEVRDSDNPTWQTGPALGTASYISPEQASGRVLDARSDLFSLGAVLYEMAHGSLPSQAPVENVHVPKEFERIIGKAMAECPERRYQTAAELRDDLKRLKAKLRGRGRRRMLALVSGLVAVAALAGHFLLGTKPPSRLSGHNTVFLADFNNTTGEAVFDETLKQAVRVQLEQSPFLNVVSEQKARQTLTFMGRERTTRLAGSVAREACMRTGGKAIVEGSVSTLESRYVIALSVVNCQTGEALLNEQEVAELPQGVLRALSNATTDLRARMGESLASIQKYSTPAEATTASLDALHAYSLGLSTWYSEGQDHAAPFFRRATELDPNFAMAFARLGTAYLDTTQRDRAVAATRRAYELRERVSARERFYIESHYYQIVTAQADKAIEVYKLWRETYPYDLTPYVNLGTLYGTLGQYELVRDNDLQAIQLGISPGSIYASLVNAYMDLNQFDRAEEALDAAEARKLRDISFPSLRYQLAFLQGDEKEMDRQVAMAVGQPFLQSWLLALQADTEAYRGHLLKAREFSRRAVESAKHNGNEESALAFAVVGALREAEFGNRDAARGRINELLARTQDKQVLVVGALTLARTGDCDKAVSLTRELNRRFPSDTLLNEYWLPTIRAAVDLRRRRFSRALESLEGARRYELATVPSLTNMSFYPTYLRGSAYLATGHADQAEVEFLKILGHPGLVGNYLLGALTRLSLGRAYAIEAGVAVQPAIIMASAGPNHHQTPEQSEALQRARAAYADFFATWKDADPNTPLLRTARMEYREVLHPVPENKAKQFR